MLLGLLGDVHGAFDALARVMALEPDVLAWLSVGDIASESGEYPAPEHPLYFIKGNNEDFDFLAHLARVEPGRDPAASPNLFFLPNGVGIDVERLQVVGLGGTFAPTWYETRPEDLPAFPRRPRRASSGEAAPLDVAARDLSRRSGGASKADDKRRHFVRVEVEACKAARGVDVFLSHEAPRPYWVSTGRGRNDAGKTVINEILAEMKPRLHVFGHHHRFSEATRQGVPSIGLPLVSDGYLVLDTESWKWTRKDSAAAPTMTQGVAVRAAGIEESGNRKIEK